MWPLSLSSMDPSSLRALRLCSLYGITSMLIGLNYKLVLSTYAYDSKFLMLSEQLTVSLIFCAFARRFLSHVPGLEVPPIRLSVMRGSILSGLLFVANIVVGWYGLQLVPIPLFLCLRRTTTAFTLLLEYVVLGRGQSASVNASVVLIVSGAVLAGWQSMSSAWLGFAYTMLNNLLTAASMIFQKRFSDTSNVKGFGLVQYNALIALPICLLGATWNDEWTYTHEFSKSVQGGFWTAMASASLMGLCMTYITFLCTTVNSPLATSVTGNAKDVVATVVAALIFQDFVPTAASVGGILLSFVGAAWFSLAKLQEAAQASKRAAEAQEDERITVTAGGGLRVRVVHHHRVGSGSPGGGGGGGRSRLGEATAAVAGALERGMWASPLLLSAKQQQQQQRAGSGSGAASGAEDAATAMAADGLMRYFASPGAVRVRATVAAPSAFCDPSSGDDASGSSGGLLLDVGEHFRGMSPRSQHDALLPARGSGSTAALPVAAPALYSGKRPAPSTLSGAVCDDDDEKDLEEGPHGPAYFDSSRGFAAPKPHGTTALPEGRGGGAGLGGRGAAEEGEEEEDPRPATPVPGESAAVLLPRHHHSQHHPRAGSDPARGVGAGSSSSSSGNSSSDVDGGDSARSERGSVLQRAIARLWTLV